MREKEFLKLVGARSDKTSHWSTRKNEKIAFELSTGVTKRQNQFFKKFVLAPQEVSFFLCTIEGCVIETFLGMLVSEMKNKSLKYEKK